MTPKPPEPAVHAPDDWLGYGRYADALWSRVLLSLTPTATDAAQRLARSQLPTADPLVVGVYGEWGAGKSRLLELVYQRAAAENAKTLAQRVRDPQAYAQGRALHLTVPVWFHPWKYEHEPHLGVPLMMHVTDALRASLAGSATLKESTERALVAAGETVASAAEKVGAAATWIDGAAKVAHHVAGHALVRTTVGVAAGVFGAGELAQRGLDLVQSTAASIAGLPDDNDDESGSEPSAKKPGDKKPTDKKAKPGLHAAVPLPAPDGRYYYNVQKYLRELCHITPAGAAAHRLQLDHDIHLRFVVFVDDLDRCLPEKAVEVLEVIKTLLNVDTFAFVVALDDEVIERGIAHRYRDYRFEGAKPEMPITGFEYLEKIVHLPFRLPQLTRAQAMAFLRHHEDRLMADPLLPASWQRLWFQSAAHGTRGAEVASLGVSKAEPAAAEGAADDATVWQPTALSDLLLDSFEAQVPRKLARAQELMHQLQQVLHGRGQPLVLYPAGATRPPDKPGDPAPPDAALLLHFVLLQLFAPELFRLLRRRPEVWREWMQAHLVLESAHEPVFSPRRNPGEPHFDLKASDALLFRWAAVGARAGRSQEAPSTTAMFAPVAKPETPLREWSGNLAQWRGQMAEHLGLDAAALHSAEQVRLPLVLALCAYRDAQRHAYNPLHGGASLVATMGWVTPEQLPRPARYLQLFAEASSVVTIAASLIEEVASNLAGEIRVAAASANRVRHDISLGLLREVAGSKDASARAALVERVGLQPGDLLAPEAVRELVAATAQLSAEQQLALWSTVAQHLAAENVGTTLLPALEAAVTVADLGNAAAAEPIAARLAVLKQHGLLAALGLEHAERQARERLIGWRDDAHIDIKERAAAADALAPLGDERFRFDPARWHLPGERAATPEEEPIVGFVRVPAGRFTRGESGESDNPPDEITLPHPCYLARTLTTVAQWAAFIADEGYDDNRWWPGQAGEWRDGRFDSQVKDEDYQKRLAQRPAAQRRQPWRWDEQRPFVQRPVWGVSWFEARAYARWLADKLRGEIGGAHLAGYQVRLPTEDQWERAARARTLADVDTRRWPWGDEEAAAAGRANLLATGLGEACAVGLFPPNPLGLCDLAGNLWEWQDNLYAGAAKPGMHHRRPPMDRPLNPAATFNASDMPALRGGSWIGPTDFARCAYRFRSLPGSFGYVGVRVVLSLVEKDS